MRADQRDLRHDYAERQKGVNDQADITRDKADIRADRRDIRADGKDIHADQTDIQKDRKDIQADRKDIGKDRADMRADQRDLRTDRQDLRANQSDLRKDQGVISNQDARRNDLRASTNVSASQSLSGKTTEAAKPGITTAKPEITPATIANNTAENSQKARAAQNVQKSWWHFW
jgi:hypothetical protein